MHRCDFSENGEEIRNAVTPITRTQKLSRHIPARSGETDGNFSTSSFQPVVPRTCVATENCFVAYLPVKFDMRSSSSCFDATATSSDSRLHSSTHARSKGDHLATSSYFTHQSMEEHETEASPKRARMSGISVNQCTTTESDELDDADTCVGDSFTKDDDEPSRNGSFEAGRMKGSRNETKRRSHSEIERKRRSRINSSIESLARLVIANDLQVRDSLGVDGNLLHTSARRTTGSLIRHENNQVEASLQRAISKWSKVDILARTYELLERLARENEEGRVAVAMLRTENERLRALVSSGTSPAIEVQPKSNVARTYSRLVDALQKADSS